MEEYISCFSCGTKSLNIEGESHDYMLASSGCYEMFNEILEKEYSNFTYAKAHHYTVDAYATQHPGKATNSKAVNSVGIHLVSLYFLFEKRMSLTLAADLKMEFAQFNKTYNIITPLEKPARFEGITIHDIWDNENPEKHFELCEKWARNAWTSWKDQHQIIDDWAVKFLKISSFEIK